MKSMSSSATMENTNSSSNSNYSSGGNNSPDVSQTTTSSTMIPSFGGVYSPRGQQQIKSSSQSPSHTISTSTTTTQHKVAGFGRHGGKDDMTTYSDTMHVHGQTATQLSSPTTATAGAMSTSTTLSSLFGTSVSAINDMKKDPLSTNVNTNTSSNTSRTNNMNHVNDYLDGTMSPQPRGTGVPIPFGHATHEQLSNNLRDHVNLVDNIEQQQQQQRQLNNKDELQHRKDALLLNR